MQELVREYLNDLGKKHKKRRRFRVVSVLFALIVVGGVIWGLARAGIATTGEPRCGREEHQHTDACYSDVLNCGMEESSGHTHTDDCYQTAEPELICGMEESEEHAHTDECYQTAEPELICGQEEYEGHTHTDACYTKQLSCGKEEHQHEDDCYIDKSADVEDASKWNAQYEGIEWENAWGKDLVTAAKLQLDYKESVANYTVAEDGSHKGYTRYGQFNGDPYADWDAAFVNFCMYYAGLTSSEMFPDEKDTQEWYDKFTKDDEGKKKVYLTTPDGYEPQEGDLIFLKKENEETKFQMGIVSSYNKEDKEKNEIKVIEGNSENQVKENTYKIDDEHISEYLKITEMEEAYKEAQKQPEQQPVEDGTDTQAPEEKTIELTTEVDGVTITLFGPESSFEADKEYTIQAEKVENEEVLATVEEAVEQMAEEQEKKVENFQPYDIKLLLDGEEVQPLGPVSVKFSGKEVVKSVENEETEVSVIHVDENTGKTTDMEATPTEEKEVVIETEHFSIYVYLEVSKDNFKSGGADIDIQHWGREITTIRKLKEGETEEEEAFDTTGLSVKTENIATQLYSTDEGYHVPFEAYFDLKKLSKVYNTTGKIEDDESGAETETVTSADAPRYEISEVWVSNGTEGANYSDTIENWVEGTFTRYTKEQLDAEQKKEDRPEIRDLKDGDVIRFWYTPLEETKPEDVMFYDYNLSNSGKSEGNAEGINSLSNYDAKSDNPKLGIGQWSSGNKSPCAAYPNNGTTGAIYDSKNLNKGNDHSLVRGIPDDKLDEAGNIKFSSVNVPEYLFKDSPSNGSVGYEDYKLEFKQRGDTYTLTNVINPDGSKMISGSDKGDLTKFYSMAKWGGGVLYSNKFWPLDNATGQKDEYVNKGSDFTETHNWHFGMTYEVEFEIGDYTGPMEYYFRGDDDFWLYVDGYLAVDLGGIHSAIGHTFNLKEFIDQKVEKGLITKEGTHKLKVYYMERGGFGSCCYMQFTLPRARITKLEEPDVTQFTVVKEWRDADNGFRPEQIEVTLLKEKGDNPAEEVDTVILPQKGQNGEDVWSYTWDKLPEMDGKTKERISYSVKEELIDPRNKENPMLGYHVTKDIQGTTATLVNTMDKKKVKIIKEWEGDENELVNRPDSVQFVLYANGERYRDFNGNYKPAVTLSDKGGIWEGEFDNLPEYYYNSLESKWMPVEYTVVEYPTKLTGKEIDGKNGAVYQVRYDKLQLDEESQKAGYIAIFKATNKLSTKNLCIEKVGRSDNKPEPHLRNVVFALYGSDYYKSGTDGKPEINESAGDRGRYTTNDDGVVEIRGLPFGTYYLVEIQAPSSYAILDNPIKIEVSERGVTAEFQIADWDDDENVKLVEEDGFYKIKIPNEMMYELPSTGGSGIYWYMFSGMLLMMAASLITYRNKRREVLRS